jgi:hypothetical protein
MSIDFNKFLDNQPVKKSTVPSGIDFSKFAPTPIKKVGTKIIQETPQAKIPNREDQIMELGKQAYSKSNPVVNLNDENVKNQVRSLGMQEYVKQSGSDYLKKQGLSDKVKFGKSFVDTVKKAPKAVADFLLSSEKKFGETIGVAAATKTKEYKEALESKTKVADYNNAIMRAIEKNKKEGKPVDKLIRLYNQNAEEKIDPASIVGEAANKTGVQIAGEAGGTLLDMLSFGTYGKAAKGGLEALKGAQLAKTPVKELLKMAGKQVLKEDLPIGLAYGFTGALQENSSPKEILKETLKQGATNALMGGVMRFAGGVVGRKIAQSKMEQALSKGAGELEQNIGKKAEQIARNANDPTIKYEVSDNLGVDKNGEKVLSKTEIKDNGEVVIKYAKELDESPDLKSKVIDNEHNKIIDHRLGQDNAQISRNASKNAQEAVLDDFSIASGKSKEEIRQA